MEMSGLLPDSDRILELAAVVTDAELNVLGESPVLVIHQSDAVLDGMDAWNKGRTWAQWLDRQSKSL
jgi:oligoribonuclease